MPGIQEFKSYRMLMYKKRGMHMHSPFFCLDKQTTCPHSSSYRESGLLKSNQVLDFFCGKFGDPVVTADDLVVQGLLFIKHLVDFFFQGPCAD